MSYVDFQLPLLLSASGEVIAHAEDVSGDFFDVDYVLDMSGQTDLTYAILNNTFWYTDADPTTPDKLFAVNHNANVAGHDAADASGSAFVEAMHKDVMQGGNQHGGGKLHQLHSLVSQWAPGHNDELTETPFANGGTAKIADGKDDYGKVNLGEFAVRYVAAVLFSNHQAQSMIRGEGNSADLVSDINDADKFKTQLANELFMDDSNTNMQPYVSGTNANHQASSNKYLKSIWEFMVANGRCRASGNVDTFKPFEFGSGDTFSIYIQQKINLEFDAVVDTNESLTSDGWDGDVRSNTAVLDIRSLLLTQAYKKGGVDKTAEFFMDTTKNMKAKTFKIRWTL